MAIGEYHATDRLKMDIAVCIQSLIGISSPLIEESNGRVKLAGRAIVNEKDQNEG